MQHTSQIQNIIEHFNQSKRFLYLLLDIDGNCIYINPLMLYKTGLQQNNDHPTSISKLFKQEDVFKFKKAILGCLQQSDDLEEMELLVKGIEGVSYLTNWELSVIKNQEGVNEFLQAIGTIADPSISDQNRSIELIPERYRAYEQSAEGVWMFESKEAVSIDQPHEVLIEFWGKNSFLTECNNNMLQMYGIEHKEDFLGISLGEMMDFSDPDWIKTLVDFIDEGFVLKNHETKEKDHLGNDKYFVNNFFGIVNNGKIKRVWGTQLDITDRKIAEEKLSQSELFYKNLIANSLDGIVLSDVNGVIDFASPSITKILGYSVEEVIGKKVFDFAYSEDVELAEKTFKEEIIQSQAVKFINIRLVKKDGTLLWCMVRGHNMFETPFVNRMVVYFSDDTLRFRAEKELIKSKNNLKTQANILNNVTDVIITIGLDRKIISWNNVIEKITGISSVDAIGKRFKDLIKTDYYPYTQDQVAAIVLKDGVWRGEISFESKNAEKKYFLHTVSLLYSEGGEKIGFLGVGKEITERKKVEEVLQNSERFYRRLSYYSIDGIIMSDNNGIITYSGPSVEYITGFTPSQILGYSFFDFVHPDDIEVAKKSFERELNQESEEDYVSIRIRNAKDEWVWFIVRGHNLLDIEGLNKFIIYFANDTNRKEAEEQLRQSEEKFRNIIFNFKQGVILLDNKGIAMICNPAAMEMLGLEANEILGKKSFENELDIIQENGKNYSTAQFPVARILNSNKSVRDVVMGVKQKETNDRVWLLVNAESIIGDDGVLKNIVLSLTDISEQKKLSKELLDQEIMKQQLLVAATIDGQEKEREEIGRELHDNINQYLTTARLYLEVAKEKSKGEVKKMIDLSHATLSDIVKEIRIISQSLVPPTLGDIGLVESIQELCDSFKQTQTIDIEFHHRKFVETDLTDKMKLMMFRIIQEQVNNIIRHAKAFSIMINLQSDAEFILLSISDDGKGFDLSNYKKGRGLSNISSRASLLNGNMEINTAPGKGCVISVVIPIIE